MSESRGKCAKCSSRRGGKRAKPDGTPRGTPQSTQSPLCQSTLGMLHAGEGTDCLDHGPASGRSFPRPPGGLPLCMRHEYDGARLPGAQERPAPRPPHLPPVAECRRPSASRYALGDCSRQRLGAVRKIGHRRTPWDLRSASVSGFYVGSKPSSRSVAQKVARARSTRTEQSVTHFPLLSVQQPTYVGVY